MSLTKPTKRNIFMAILIILAGVAFGSWYMFTKKFDDTSKQGDGYTVNAIDFIKEFQKNDSLANLKYIEKFISVTGIVTEVESADSIVNIKLGDTATGSYIIFAFQQQNMHDAKSIREGDKVSIKGSCSGGVYSEILATEFITFKRIVLNKKI